MNIGQKIRNAREDMDLSQMDMARMIPMNQSNYSKIERNVQEPSLEQLKRICQILRLDPCYLLEMQHGTSLTSEETALLRDAKELVRKYADAMLHG